MTFEAYLDFFKEIIEKENPSAPYDDADYMEYARLNWSRVNRWLKTGVIKEELKQLIQEINSPQKWIVITEPWCGDAAHLTPFIYMIARNNPLIHLEFELRDSEPFRIQQYLTNGSQSIPKLIIKNQEDEDFVVWGPRPQKAQDYFLSLKEKNMEHEQIKLELQKWYNEDKGQSIQDEFINIFQKAQVKTELH